jgi:hypothetical protein
MGGAVLIVVMLFYVLLLKSLTHANDKLMPRLINIEQQGPQ